MTDKTVQCWGNNVLSPTVISGLTNVIDIGVGAGHACALINDATVKCWGFNTSGEVGNGLIVSGGGGQLTPDYRFNYNPNQMIVMSSYGYYSNKICSYEPTSGDLSCTGYRSSTVGVVDSVTTAFLKSPSGL